MAAPFIPSLTLDVPTGTVVGDLMIAAISLTFTDGPIDPNIPVIVSPAGWIEQLADYPGGTLEMGDWGDGNEQIRLAVYSRVASSGEPANYTWEWATAANVECPACGVIQTFKPAAPGSVPSVNVAAAAALASVDAVVNPASIDAPSITTTVPNTIMLAFFAARNGTFPAPGGTAFTIPVGMSDMTSAVNLQTFGGGTQPLGLAMFQEAIGAAGATGTRTSDCDIDSVPPNPVRGLGYALAIQGCDGRIPTPPGPG